MKAEILVLSPFADEPDRFMTRELTACGAVVTGCRRVEAKDLSAELTAALRRCDLAAVCAPPEAFAAEAAGAVLGLPLLPDEEVLDRLKEYAGSTGVPLPADPERLCRIPRGATAFPNEQGPLAGFAAEKYQQILLCLPADPGEVAAMFHRHVAPWLAAREGSGLFSRTVGVFGLSDGDLTRRISDLLAESNPSLSLFCRRGGESLLRITARAADRTAAAALCDGTLALLRERLGSYVFGVDVTSLQAAVVALLKEKGLKIATAESCTAGLLSGRITEVSGASRVFECGVAAYSKEIKHEVLGVSREILDTQGAVCADTAWGMAAGVRRVGAADIGVSVTGEAGPTSGDGKPVGTVFIALADSRRVWVKELHVNGADRDTVRETAVCQVLDLTRRYLEALPTVMAGGQLLREKRETAPSIPAAPAAGKRRLLPAVLPWKGDRPGVWIVKLLIWLGAAAVLTAALLLLRAYVFAPAGNRDRYSSIQSMYGGTDAGYSAEEFPAGMLPRFYALYKQNPDIKGWVSVPGTGINYPVVQNSARDYSSLNFLLERSEYGTPYFDDNVALVTPASFNRSFIIHGNNTGDGQMFSDLLSYRDAGFLLSHRTVEMNTVFSTGTYQVFAVLYADGRDFDYRTVSFDSGAEFTVFTDELLARSLFTTSVKIRPDDTLLLLETAVDPNRPEIRLIVAARLTDREEEQEEFSVARNPSPLLPAAMTSRATGDGNTVTTLPDGRDDYLPDIAFPTVTDTVSASLPAGTEPETAAVPTGTEPETTAGASSQTAGTTAETAAPALRTTVPAETDTARETESTAFAGTTVTEAETAPSVPDETGTETAGTETAGTEPAGTEPAATEPAATEPQEEKPAYALPESRFYKTITVKIAGGTPYAIQTREDLHYAVACIAKTEIGASRMMMNSTEAQKAMAVAGYTFLLYDCKNGKTSSISSRIDLNDPNDRKIYDAVAEVVGYKMIDTAQTDPDEMALIAMYFGSCPGATASIQHVYTANLPYLQSVESPYDTEEYIKKYRPSDSLTSTYTVAWQELKADLDAFVAKETGGAVTEVSAEEGDLPLFAKTFDGAGSYVVDTNLYYRYRGRTVHLRGIDIRKVIGSSRLRSHCFTVAYDPETDLLTFTVLGHGHGLGLSMYGAIGYANEEGWNWRQILNHYFSLSDTGRYRIVEPNWEE